MHQQSPSSGPQANVERRISKVDEDIGQNRRLPTSAPIEPAEAHQLGDALGRDGHSQHDPPKPARRG
jgi:hypothetical protein